MTETEKRWMRERLETRTEVKAIMSSIYAIASGELYDCSSEMVKKAQRYVRQYEEDPSGRQLDKAFLKRIHKLYSEWLKSDAPEEDRGLFE